MVNGFIHKSEGGILILPQKRFTLNNYLWNPRSCFFRILFTSIICFIFIKFIFYQFKEPFFVFKTNKTFIPSKNKFLNFTITFSNVQKDYLMEEPFIEPCKGKQIKLLVLIMSRRETFYKRMGIIIRFVIGRPKLKEENSTLLENKLNGEQKVYGDLIRYSIEDDSKKGPAFFGVVYGKSRPIRDPGNKWYVPYEHFPGNLFPRYMQGASYFGNGKAIKLIMQHTKEAIGFNMDDILFTGTLAEIANVSRIDYAWIHFRGGNDV
uniref:Hexosyltransferase n=1 Tax=Meloidogyne floridensis TaxID=298350 RepID=A0A915P1Y9_9BILA